MRYLVQFSGATRQFRIATADSPDSAVEAALREVSVHDIIFPILVNPIDDEKTFQFTASVEYKVSVQTGSVTIK